MLCFVRFQDIAGTLESCLTLPMVLAATSPESARPHPPYELELFGVLEQCIEQCWSDAIFIPALVHRFWKLTLQVSTHLSQH